MRKGNVLTALAAVAMMVHVLGTTQVALAVDPDVNFSFSPTSGLPGTTITFTGTGCPHNPGATSDGVFLLTKDGSSGRPVPFTSDAEGDFSGEYDTTGDSPGTYTTVISCLTTDKDGIGSPFTVTAPPPPPAPPGSTYSAVAPVRILDTREGIGAPDAQVGPDGVINLKVTGVAGVPTEGVAAVTLNVTVTNASGPFSYLTVWPTGGERPDTSNINFTQGVAVPNLVVARVGTDGNVSIYNNVGTVDIVADVQGWYAGTSGSLYNPVSPQRILDTRSGTGVSAPGQVGPGGVIEIAVTGVAGVPTDAAAVVLNMTVDRATGPESWLTVWPSGGSLPNASNLNFTGGPATTNLVVARVGGGGKVAIYNNNGFTDVIADIQGWFGPAGGTTGSRYFPTSPARVLDSRAGIGTPNGAVGQLGIGGFIDVPLTGVGGVPASGVTAVVFNLTAADSPGPESYLTVYPTGTPRPDASNLNFVGGENVANLVFARVGSDGRVSIYNNVGSTNVIGDIQGWFAPPPS